MFKKYLVPVLLFLVSIFVIGKDLDKPILSNSGYNWVVEIDQTNGSYEILPRQR